MTLGKTTSEKVFTVLGIGLLILAGVNCLFAGETTYPARFFIERQAFWNDGKYFVKYTFMCTAMTLVDVIAVPWIFIRGVALHAARKDLADVVAPPGWDVEQRGRRIKFALLALACAPVWLVYTALALYAPDVLEPLGFFAGILLILIPGLPLLIPAFIFEALVPPRYVEGVLTSISHQGRGSSARTHLYVGTEEFKTTPKRAVGLVRGAPVRFVVSGFFGRLDRIEQPRAAR
jgi:hypothetical protein